jgi:hypothetical protein
VLMLARVGRCPQLGPSRSAVPAGAGRLEGEQLPGLCSFHLQ